MPQTVYIMTEWQIMSNKYLTEFGGHPVKSQKIVISVQAFHSFSGTLYPLCPSYDDSYAQYNFKVLSFFVVCCAGATRDIGSALTRMCMRHRSIEAKLRHFTKYDAACSVFFSDVPDPHFVLLFPTLMHI